MWTREILQKFVMIDWFSCCLWRKIIHYFSINYFNLITSLLHFLSFLFLCHIFSSIEISIWHGHEYHFVFHIMLIFYNHSNLVNTWHFFLFFKSLFFFYVSAESIYVNIYSTSHISFHTVYYLCVTVHTNIWSHVWSYCTYITLTGH